jgi:hypothetical protein
VLAKIRFIVKEEEEEFVTIYSIEKWVECLLFVS